VAPPGSTATAAGNAFHATAMSWNRFGAASPWPGRGSMRCGGPYGCRHVLAVAFWLVTHALTHPPACALQTSNFSRSLDARWHCQQGARQLLLLNGTLQLVLVDTSPFVPMYRTQPWAGVPGGPTHLL
jgi:hypothetical protein